MEKCNVIKGGSGEIMRIFIATDEGPCARECLRLLFA